MPTYNDPSEPPKAMKPAPELNHLSPTAWNYGLTLRACRPKQYAQMKAAGTLRKHCEDQAEAFHQACERMEEQGVDPQAADEIARADFLLPKSESQEVWEAGGQPEDGDDLVNGRLVRAKRPKA